MTEFEPSDIPEEVAAVPQEGGHGIESESEMEFKERVEAIANDARKFLGFEAPLHLTIHDLPEGRPPTARSLRSAPEPYKPSSEPMEIQVFRPNDAAGREQLERSLSFMVPHEVAHSYPTPRSIDLRAFPGSEHRYFSSGTHLNILTVATGRDEVITDVLALRSLGGVGQMSDAAWDSYRFLFERAVEPHGGTDTPWFRDSLRGMVEAEALASDPAVTEERRAWLIEWLPRARAVLEKLEPNDRALLDRAKQYLERSYRAAWDLPIGKPKPEVEPSTGAVEPR